MKKNRIILSSLIIFGAVLCFVLLRCLFNVEVANLVEETLIAALTGCIFAIPSGIVVLFAEYKTHKLFQGKLLSDLYSAFNDFNMGDFSSYSTVYIAAKKDHIHRLYDSLLKNNIEHLGVNTNRVSELLRSIFDFCLLVSDFNEKFLKQKIATPDEFGRCVDKIVCAKTTCVEIIESLQKNK